MAYENAIEKWNPESDRYTKHEHAMKNPSEYWAEGVGLWFENVDHQRPKYATTRFLNCPLICVVGCVVAFEKFQGS